MNALEEYRNVAILVVDKPGFYTIVSAADAAIAELRAKNERLLGSVEILQEALKNQRDKRDPF